MNLFRFKRRGIEFFTICCQAKQGIQADCDVFIFGIKNVLE